MLTKLSFKVSFFAALITFISCFIMDIPLGESTKRSLIVFVGFYLILISFFICLRMIISPRDEEPVPEKEIESGEDEDNEQIAEGDTIGVESE